MAFVHADVFLGAPKTGRSHTVPQHQALPASNDISISVKDRRHHSAARHHEHGVSIRSRLLPLIPTSRPVIAVGRSVKHGI
ncbi:hypothetical protein BAUCODRAFT_464621 [Baudoinia panamericana UAMH 10762]|uniref:Uncharacterized protein n=1 Tax=Baudoinia panamericana (strain UAMH 10762) TaxID=717646 RepID=M2NB87_BAUPA|nr:uncharacterized protein BAUCODRAFT_464621 [Baudoinia panamericana UAMH 10762]EMC96130.1 hypothetical protein BAUCODRAFT_464621 [Baudoinia panamericana UAMH 10762]